MSELESLPVSRRVDLLRLLARVREALAGVLDTVDAARRGGSPYAVWDISTTRFGILEGVIVPLGVVEAQGWTELVRWLVAMEECLRVGTVHGEYAATGGHAGPVAESGVVSHSARSGAAVADSRGAADVPPGGCPRLAGRAAGGTYGGRGGSAGSSNSDATARAISSSSE